MQVKRIVLHFPPQLVNEPIIYKLSRDYELEFNILKASITPDEEGLLVLELKGEDDKYRRAIEYLTKAGVRTQPLSQDITVADEKCTSCGLCVPMCPTGAFEVAASSKKVEFSLDKCIACGICVDICPFDAIEVKL